MDDDDGVTDDDDVPVIPVSDESRGAFMEVVRCILSKTVHWLQHSVFGAWASCSPSNILPNELLGDGVCDELAVVEGDGVTLGDDVCVDVEVGVAVCDGVCDDEGVTAALAQAVLRGTPVTPRKYVPGAGVATRMTAPPLGRAYRAVGVVASSVNDTLFLG